MEVTRTFRHKLPGEQSDFAFRLPRHHRTQMGALAAHRGWSEAEAMRRAVALFLDQNRDLLKVLCPDEEAPNGR